MKALCSLWIFPGTVIYAENSFVCSISTQYSYQLLCKLIMNCVQDECKDSRTDSTTLENRQSNKHFILSNGNCTFCAVAELNILSK